MFLQLHSWIKFYLEFALLYFQSFYEHCYSQWAEFDPIPVLGNKVWWQHSHAHYFPYCLWLFLCCDCKGEWSYCPQDLKYLLSSSLERSIWTQIHWHSAWPQASFLTSLGFSFLICKIKTMMVPTSRGFYDN